MDRQTFNGVIVWNPNKGTSINSMVTAESQISITIPDCKLPMYKHLDIHIVQVLKNLCNATIICIN